MRRLNLRWQQWMISQRTCVMCGAQATLRIKRDYYSRSIVQYTCTSHAAEVTKLAWFVMGK